MSGWSTVVFGADNLFSLISYFCTHFISIMLCKLSDKVHLPYQADLIDLFPPLKKMPTYLDLMDVASRGCLHLAVQVLCHLAMPVQLEPHRSTLGSSLSQETEVGGPHKLL